MARVGLQPFILNINLHQQLTFTLVGSQGTHLVFVNCFFLYIDVSIYAVNTIVDKGYIIVPNNYLLLMMLLYFKSSTTLND